MTALAEMLLPTDCRLRIRPSGAPGVSTEASNRLDRVTSMTAAPAHNEPVHAPPHAQALICGSATLIAHVYGWLTAITLAGEIDATNADQVSDQAVKLVPEDSALIVDMDGVDFIGVDGLRALLAMNLECIRTDTRWAVITSHAVDRLLRVGDREGLV